MPRGGHRVDLIKPAKAQANPNNATGGQFNPSLKLIRRNTDWNASFPTPGLLSKTLTGSKLAAHASSASRLPPESARLQESATGSRPVTPEIIIDSAHINEAANRPSSLSTHDSHDTASSASIIRSGDSDSIQSTPESEADTSELDKLRELNMDENQATASSLYSRDSSSIYSRDSASIYSSASSIYSSGASVYSFDECDIDRTVRGQSTDLIPEEDEDVDGSRFLASAHCTRRASTISVRPQDAAARERSTLVKKAAWFKNSRLSPELPTYETTLPVWSMVCRAMQASQDCYGSRTITTRRGIYTPSDTAKDIKAMLVDDQFIDQQRVIIVAIRGTKFQSLSDWAVNKAANPTSPSGFLDDEHNACHAGFLQVAKAMVEQVAAQLREHPALPERPSLLITGHSAGGAVAAMLYSHMVSTSVQSDLVALASHFSSINCITFGAPPLSQTPLKQRGGGVFLAFANEGDPVLRLSDAAYVKSLAKLMTASQPASIAVVAAPTKVVRRSRGNGVIRQAPVAPVVPWEELPLWPTPPTSLTNAGDIILLRDDSVGAVASKVTVEELSDVIFGDLAQHTTEMYLRRLKEVTLDAMMGLTERQTLQMSR